MVIRLLQMVGSFLFSFDPNDLGKEVEEVSLSYGLPMESRPVAEVDVPLELQLSGEEHELDNLSMNQPVIENAAVPETQDNSLSNISTKPNGDTDLTMETSAVDGNIDQSHVGLSSVSGVEVSDVPAEVSQEVPGISESTTMKRKSPVDIDEGRDVAQTKRPKVVVTEHSHDSKSQSDDSVDME